MRTASLLLALIASAAASPAIVWDSKADNQIHNSEVTGLRSLVESESASVVFVVERDENGSEGLTKLTSSGSLPKVASKYAEASSINHYVAGIENVEKAIKELGSATATTLENYKTEAAAMKATVNTEGVNKMSDIFVVSISKESTPSDIDSIVAEAIEDKNIGSVVLTSVRGLSEVKFERNLMAKQEYFEAMEKTSRRRLEDAGDDGDDGNYSNTIYFVNYTPNIFSGVLFFFFFSAITYTGIGCMGSIAGQDLYVTKYPTIGREA